MISMLDHYLACIALTSLPAISMQIIASDRRFLAWRIITGLNVDIALHFMRVGHTCCFVDGNFGLIKQSYRNADVNMVQQLTAVIARSSKNEYLTRVSLGLADLG